MASSGNIVLYGARVNRSDEIAGILIDLEGNDRDPATPDVGCFENQYE